MKTYKVWIEVEEYDDETESGKPCGGLLSFASTAEFSTLEKAEHFAERLNATGEELAKDADACDCSDCDRTVYENDPYFATPCGTYCSECIRKHVKACGVCSDEFTELEEEEEETE